MRPPRGVPGGMTEEEKAAFIRRRRGRNYAVLFALLGLVGLFFLIAMARLTQG
ncbi:hypothetical protein [Teichococcus rhizosphaerae]|uniref:hypothetical protein n=1 Tax=Teichococcus rhizosphaerae TaxID=1335062 RepID=UPI00159B8C98|nr:hypothetical protein [Pseudoroseomonas rhizosphaerae]